MNTYEVHIEARGEECGTNIEVKVILYPILAATQTSAINKSKVIFKPKFKGYTISQVNAYVSPSL